MNRREFLSSTSAAAAWLPFFPRHHVELAGMPFHVLRNGRSGRRFLHIHGDEPTARDVLTRLMKTHPGIAYLIDNLTRNVTIQGAQIDPNRLFSRVGAEKSLQSQNPAIAPERVTAVLDFLDRHRENLVRHLTPRHGDLLFALHNNRDYSVKDEIDQSDEISMPQPDHPREFFLSTDPHDFARLRKSPYNVVLQNKKPSVNDGSLSRLAARRGFRYLNLECAIGQFDAQMERVLWVEQNLR